jgi:ribose-phosphate pyrophosphokinase
MILNLVYPEKSGIKYKISKFPDGQQTIDIEYINTNTIEIRSRFNSFKDLELIICANQALINMGATHISLYVPYFLGSRSDRKFQSGGVNYLKQVICPIINSQNFSSVTVVDPHSDVLEGCLNNFKKINNFDLVDDALAYLIGEEEEDRVILVSPDAGALKKIYDVAKEFEITNVVTASKIRDIKTGDVIKTELPIMDFSGVEHIVIIDDICDGGRTFVELAKAIKRHTSKPIYLVVTHGIFSAGLDLLSQYFETIYCTNSVSDIRQNDKLIQLNIF